MVQAGGPKLSERDYYPRMKEDGNALVRVVGSTPDSDKQDYVYRVLAAITFAEHFYSSDECLFCSR